MPDFEAEYTCDEVAKRAGTNIQDVRTIKGAGPAMKIMGEGTIAIVGRQDARLAAKRLSHFAPALIDLT